MSFDLDSEEISARFAEVEDDLERLKNRYECTKMMYGIAILLLCFAVFMLALPGCYLEHDAEPCYDVGEAAPEAQTRAHGQGAVTAGSAASTYPGPCPFTYDEVNCYCVSPTHEICKAGNQRWCEGPIVGCIAPGSPLSNTWEPGRWSKPLQ